MYRRWQSLMEALEVGSATGKSKAKSEFSELPASNCLGFEVSTNKFSFSEPKRRIYKKYLTIGNFHLRKVLIVANKQVINVHLIECLCDGRYVLVILTSSSYN